MLLMQSAIDELLVCFYQILIKPGVFIQTEAEKQGEALQLFVTNRKQITAFKCNEAQERT